MKKLQSKDQLRLLCNRLKKVQSKRWKEKKKRVVKHKKYIKKDGKEYK